MIPTSAHMEYASEHSTPHFVALLCFLATVDIMRLYTQKISRISPIHSSLTLLVIHMHVGLFRTLLIRGCSFTYVVYGINGPGFSLAHWFLLP
jgi:hypothetical protein